MVKFKVLFIFFNSILIVSFFFIFFMPFFIIGGEYAYRFWQQNWYLSLFFLIMLAGLNGYFLKHWKVFTLMEEENWRGIQAYLEEAIEKRRGLSEQNARILMNAYMVLGQMDRLQELSSVLKSRFPKVFRNLALELGVPYLLRSDPAGLEKYYGPLASDKSSKHRDWAKFSLVLGCIFNHRYAEAIKNLEDFQHTPEEPLLFLLSAYLLSTLQGEDPEVRKRLEEAKKKFSVRFSKKKWEQRIEQLKENLWVLVLIRLIQDATRWMFDIPEEGHGSKVF